MPMVDDPEFRARIHIDASICGGRPHIRAPASGWPTYWGCWLKVCHEEILADYPYLSELARAALAFGAAASAHRIILAA